MTKHKDEHYEANVKQLDEQAKRKQELLDEARERDEHGGSGVRGGVI